jgi:hypothetical protein
MLSPDGSIELCGKLLGAGGTATVCSTPSRRGRSRLKLEEEADASPREGDEPPLTAARSVQPRNVFQDDASINSPGEWDVMISYTQANPNAKLLAHAMHTALCERGRTVWLDVKMAKLNSAAMKEAAHNSKCIIAVVTGPAVNPEKPADKPETNAYYARKYTLNELRWARENGVPIQPVVWREDKPKIGEFIDQLPADLKALGDVDFKTMDQTGPAFWRTSVDEVLVGVDDLVADAELPPS